jgi:hypothetical protein
MRIDGRLNGKQMNRFGRGFTRKIEENLTALSRTMSKTHDLADVLLIVR